MIDCCQNYFHNIIILLVVNNMSKFLYLAWQGDTLFGLFKKYCLANLSFISCSAELVVQNILFHIRSS
jgi:hypothetical protein